MTLISIIYVARDDNYGDDYNIVEFPDNDKRKTDINFYKKFIIKYNNIQRIKCTLEHNIKLLDKYFQNEYEIIFVDWSPLFDKYLTSNHELCDILKNEKIKNIIVKNEVVKNNGLNPKGFYEYYGKNIGIRQSKGQYILISNPDDIISDILMSNIYSQVIKEPKNEYYRCYSRLDVDHELNVINEGLSFPKNGNVYDEIIGTPASGDFVLIQNEILVNITGYHEEYSLGNQTSLDGKLLVNLYNNKIKPIVLGGSILHLDHKKHNRSGQTDMVGLYKNNKNWGFNNYTIRNIDNIYTLEI